MSTSARDEMIQNAKDMVALYLAAEKAVLTGQAYSIAGHSLTRADLEKIRAGRKEWETKLDAYAGRYGRSMGRFLPMDD